MTSPLTLWYRQPAREWVEALPVGNGRLGAMVFGGAGEERLQLNEDTFWSGSPYDPSSSDALEALPEARRLIFAGEYAAAHELVENRMLGRPKRQCSYQPVGDLRLRFAGRGPAAAYRRELDLDTAVASVTELGDGVTLRREVFASAVDHVLVVRLSADAPAHVSLQAELSSPQPASVAVEDGHTLVMRGRAPDAITEAEIDVASLSLQSRGAKP